LSTAITTSHPDTTTIPTHRPHTNENHTLATALATLHTHGTPITWTTTTGNHLNLPTYPFQHRHYWAKSRPETVTDPLRYRETWVSIEPGGAPVLSGTWLVMTSPASRHEEACIAALEQYGARTIILSVEPGEEILGRLRLAVGDSPIAGVLSLLALDVSPHPGSSAVPAGLAATAELVAAEVDAPVWAVTSGAAHDPDQAMVWGFGRVAAAESPERWGGLIDLPAVLDESAQRRLAGVLAAADGEDEIALRPSGTFARRLVRAPGSGDAWQPSGTVLITGGTGALGGSLAKWLAVNGAEHVVLTSRSGEAAPGAAELVADLTGLGVRATVVACDVAERAAVADLFERLTGEGSALTAVFHAAGVLDDGMIAAQDVAKFATVLRAKATAASNLHECTKDLDLAAFVLYSSTAGTVGNPGQANYAAANACLDALARMRRESGLPALSVAWGPWQGPGMADGNETLAGRLEHGGVAPLRPEAAFEVLRHAVAQPDPTLVVADFDWARFAPVYRATRRRRLLDLLPEAAQPERERGETTQPSFAAALAGKTGPDRERAIVGFVAEHAADVLGHASADAITGGLAFRDLGFDSLTAVELRNRVNAATGLRLPSTLVFDYPTPADLARLIDAEFGGETSPVEEPAESAVAAEDAIAIVGMACRLPGGVAGPDDLWRIVSTGTEVVSEFPADRGWREDRIAASSTRAGGFLHDVGGFDAEFFGISPREAVAMDPQQRILLETSWELFERAGIRPDSVRGSRTGVFIGTSGADYGLTVRGAGEALEGHAGIGNAGSVLSGRVAYAFGFEGPAVTVDTACSSSLVALHWAMQALRTGECSLAVAGGVTVMSTPEGFVEFSRQGGLSADGRCRAFGAGADGTGWGEGVGVLLVERLSDAVANGHEVLAVVRG
ncbi:type I polyketide synthase, partial [Amycolatopsis minnesotensis]|uniref:type I polyketide synthase n=1 Tax=Amycolatopsis minnesotensis TaxID=337894 RepID=UPI0031D79575